jgi:hypothetical protein
MLGYAFCVSNLRPSLVNGIVCTYLGDGTVARYWGSWRAAAVQHAVLEAYLRTGERRGPTLVAEAPSGPLLLPECRLVNATKPPPPTSCVGCRRSELPENHPTGGTTWMPAQVGIDGRVGVSFRWDDAARRSGLRYGAVERIIACQITGRNYRWRWCGFNGSNFIFCWRKTRISNRTMETI